MDYEEAVEEWGLTTARWLQLTQDCWREIHRESEEWKRERMLMDTFFTSLEDGGSDKNKG